MKQMTFGMALKDYFGLTTTEVMKEVKSLDKADREWFKKELATVGYEITDAVPAK